MPGLTNPQPMFDPSWPAAGRTGTSRLPGAGAGVVDRTKGWEAESKGGHVIEAWKKRVREYRARAAELRAKAETISNIKELNAAVRDAEMWERMADWEEKNPPAPY
jgi:hypothetical protein